MKINVTKSSMPGFNEFCDEIRDVWDSRWLTNHGKKVQELEAKLKDYLGVKNVVLYTNGHLALEAAISYFNFPRGSEIITTPFTFVSTTNAIIRSGMTPVFCDIKASDYTIDPSKVKALITDKTVAIMPVHVYGNICDVEAIERIAKKHNLKVIYDAAHAFGVKDAAKHGDISMFSFHATKVFHTIEGGCLCFKDDSIKPLLEHQKDFGIVDPENCDSIGGNAKMNEFQASMGLCNLRHIDEYIEKRRIAVKQYFKRLSSVKGIRLLDEKSFILGNCAYFPVVFDGFKKTRDEIKDELAKQDIGARKYFYPLTNSFSPVKGKYKGDTPVAVDISNKVLTLPLYSDLSIEDVDKICDVILN